MKRLLLLFTLLISSNLQSLKVRKILTFNDYTKQGNYPVFATFSPDGNFLASRSLLGSAVLRNIPQKKEKFFNQGVKHITFTPDNTSLAIRTRSEYLSLQDLSSLKEINGIFLGESKSNAFAFSPSTNTVASDCETGFIDLCNLSKNKTTYMKINAHKGSITALAFSPCGEKIVSASKDGSIKLWNLAEFDPNSILPEDLFKNWSEHEFIGTATSFPKRDYTRKTGPVLEMKTIQFLKLKGHDEGEITDIRFSPDGKYIAAASSNGKIYVWHAYNFNEETPPLITNFCAHKAAVNSIDFSQDGKLLVSASDDGTFIVWDILAVRRAHPKPYEVFKEHNDSVTSVSCNPRKNILVTTSKDGSTHLWELYNEDEEVAEADIQSICDGFNGNLKIEE